MEYNALCYFCVTFPHLSQACLIVFNNTKINYKGYLKKVIDYVTHVIYIYRELRYQLLIYIYNLQVNSLKILQCDFLDFFSYFVSHSWGIPMMKITGLSHLFKWENLHNWWLTKYFFAPLYIHIHIYTHTVYTACIYIHTEQNYKCNTFVFAPHFSWAELKDLRLFLYTQKAYLSRILFINLSKSVLVSTSPLPR